MRKNLFLVSSTEKETLSSKTVPDVVGWGPVSLSQADLVLPEWDFQKLGKL